MKNLNLNKCFVLCCGRNKVNSLLILIAFLFSFSSDLLSQTPYKSLNYLYSIKGTRTVAGQHNKEPNSNPAQWTNWIKQTTGNYPGLWSGDFLFASSDINTRWTMIYEAERQWNAGALVNIMWHACNPVSMGPCNWSGGVQTTLSNAQWTELITNGTNLNNRWKAMMDDVSQYLQYLENKGVEVLWRPLHEQNQGAFWWAGRTGANGSAKLWQITYDYMKYTKGLSNLIWVWDIQDFGSLATDLGNYNPGSNYYDVAALDVYEGFATWKYDAMRNFAGSKPIAIGECDVLPTASRLSAEPQWTFFMAWAELVQQRNSVSAIQNLYWAGNVIVREEMPGWNSTPPPTNVNLAYNRPVTTTSNENTTNTGAKAVDANGTTRWSSGYANNQNFVVDLGANYNINRVRIAWEAAYAKDYQIQVSTNNSTWTTIRDVWGKSSSGADDLTGLSGTARWVKIYCINRATTYGFSFWEFEVYGSPASARLGDNVEIEDNIAIYPNPTVERVTVNLSESFNKGGKISLLTSTGKVLRTEKINGKEHSFSLSDLSDGIYFIEIQSSDGRKVRKVYKN